MSKRKFFICRHCGNVITMMDGPGVPVTCCGEKMQELVAGATDAAGEKHVPVVTVENSRVNVEVGSVTHPMTEEHSIAWVYLQTDRGGQRKCLTPDDEPAVTFALADEKPVAVYAYCNLHGLWKTEI